MTINPALAVQQAIYGRLTASAALTTLLGGARIFDSVPRKTPFPYVTLGDITTRDWNTQTQRGHEHVVTLHAWSRHHGRREAQQIVSVLDDELDGAALTLEDHILINMRVIFWTVLRDGDGETNHGIVRLRAVTEPQT